ncbi:MAG: riboflavin synthase [Calditrichaeota bacterium]|nr:MAG: riboflavin synthase [Calditrichota bacterium]
MFTGIIEEIGTISGIRSLTDGLELIISADFIVDKLRVNDSVSIDGACQTVTASGPSTFTVQAVGETLKKTTLGTFKQGRLVNLESSITLNTPLGGHLVQGHVNGTGKIVKWQRLGENYLFEIELAADLLRYCIPEGSIAVDGISLTIAKLYETRIGISIIPHTVNHTTLQYKNTGEAVNIETDLIARYLERFLTHSAKDSLTIENLQKWGY